MAYETDITQLRKQAAYEALSPAEKAAYTGFQAAKGVAKGVHKVAKFFGAKPNREELRKEVAKLKERIEERAERQTLEDVRNKLKAEYKIGKGEEKEKRKMAKAPFYQNQEPIEEQEIQAQPMPSQTPTAKLYAPTTPKLYVPPQMVFTPVEEPATPLSYSIKPGTSTIEQEREKG
jgi:hypothetical protein